MINHLDQITFTEELFSHLSELGEKTETEYLMLCHQLEREKQLVKKSHL